MSGNLAVSTINGVDISASPVVTESKVIGVEQTWQDVTASRAAGITYTNTTGKPIIASVYFSISAANQTSYAYVDSIMVCGYAGNGTYSWRSTFSLIIPNGSTYRLTISSGSIVKWSELR